MKYSILIYGSEADTDRLPESARKALLDGHRRLQSALQERGSFASVQLMPTSSAVTLRAAKQPEDGATIVTDGPFAETKEQFLGFYVAEFSSLDDALALAGHIASPGVLLEVRPVSWVGGTMVRGE